MILTPLHSQNFIDLQGGVLTNNRRLVTKTMWFNGTAISNKAQRALRNENVTIVAHSSGYVHCMYDNATMNKEAYQYFTRQLGSYLSMELTLQVFANFLRSHPNYQKFFQACRDCRGHAHFIKAEVLFHYEHGSNYRIADATHEKLLAEVSDEDFVPYQLPGRIRCDKLEEFIAKEKIDIKNSGGRMALVKFIEPVVPDAQKFVDELADFFHIEARLPTADKNYLTAKPIEINVEQSREQIINSLKQIRQDNTTADLAFYAYRDMESCDWAPFIKAAVERNPASIQMVESMSVDEVHRWLEQVGNTSIYTGKRLAQPDEVANYKTGDGLEKAFLMADIIRDRQPAQGIEIVVDGEDILLKGPSEYHFVSAKGLKKHLFILPDGTIRISS
jgi:hypothetical protein